MDPIAQLNGVLAGRYDVDREIGRGGMATVYLARDARHDRRVALKVLNPELGAVLGVERFLSEIKVTANLQHPNLLPLFDSGQADGLLFYVMPYVEGESLRARLTREKQLPVDEALRIAVSIASALDYAHRHGVIHRDLKPENVLLLEGQPLVADFGIALAVTNAGGSRVTQTGLSLGTPQYMSPEQATGDRTIDGRTDIYSLGAVLYEMLSGEPPHSGTTAQAIIARVLIDKPRSIRSSRASVPEHVERAIEHALEKLPADRYATAQEFAAVLRASPSDPLAVSAVRTHAALASPNPVQRGGSAWQWMVIAAAAAVAIAVGVVADRWIFAHRTGKESISLLIEAPPFDGGKGRFGMTGLSPDGQTVAFVVQNDTASQIFVRRLADVTPRPVAGTRGAYDLFFSPDSRTIAFFTIDGHLRKISVEGGSAIPLTDAPSYFAGGSWGRDQQIFIGEQGTENGLRRLSAAGGTATPFTKGKTQHARPLIAPDGETLLFVDWGPGFTEDDFLGIGARSTGHFTTTKLLITQPLGVVDGYAVVATADGAIKAVPFDPKAQRITGDAIRIQEGVATIGTGLAPAPIAANGTFAYLQGSTAAHLVIADTTSVRPLAGEKRNYQFPAFSPDGRRIAAAIVEQRGDSTMSDIFTFDISSGTLSRVTSRGDATAPAWTADGKSIVFTTWYQTKPSIWRQPADGGASSAEKLLEIPSGGDQIYSAAPMPDGHGVVFWRGSSDGATSRVMLLPFDGDRTPRVVATTSGYNNSALAVSPDGRWIAFAGIEGSALPRVFVIPLSGSGQRVQVSQDIGDNPVWSRDGSRLYYRHAGGIVVASIKSTGATIDVTNRAPAFPNLKQLTGFDIAPDGKHALTVQPDVDDLRLVVVTNWVQRLRERIAEAKGGK